MKTIAEQIADLEATRAAKSARMQAVMQVTLDEGRSTDTAEAEEFDTLVAEVKTIDADLARLRTLEAINVARAAPVEGATSRAGAAARLPVVARHAPKLEPGIEFARYVMCRFAAGWNPEMAFRLAERHYPDNERLVRTLRAQADGLDLAMIMKVAVEAGTSLHPTWAGPLVDYQNFAGDFIEFMRPQTVIGQFGVGNVPSLNQVPFNVRIGGQTSDGDAWWVGEGAPKPLTKFDFAAVELRWSKIATIAVLTNETIRFSSPSAERLVRDGLAAAVIKRMDIDFVDPAKAEVTNISPASILNGATAIPSSGSDADAIRADIMALWAPFLAAGNPPRSAVYLMNSSTALALSMMMNPLGQAEFPGITMNGGTFGGIPTVVSDYIPGGSAGGIVALVNAKDIYLADDGQVTIDASREASLQMTDTPTNNSATANGQSLVSMFQTNSTAFLAERFVNWKRRRPVSVTYLTGVGWGQ